MIRQIAKLRLVLEQNGIAEEGIVTPETPSPEKLLSRLEVQLRPQSIVKDIKDNYIHSDTLKLNLDESFQGVEQSDESRQGSIENEPLPTTPVAVKQRASISNPLTPSTPSTKAQQSNVHVYQADCDEAKLVEIFPKNFEPLKDLK